MDHWAKKGGLNRVFIALQQEKILSNGRWITSYLFLIEVVE
jgi:hypothetical protein